MASVFFSRLGVVITAALLAACAGTARQTRPPTREGPDPTKFDPRRALADGRLWLQTVGAEPTFRYELRTAYGGKLLATAQSAFSLEKSGGGEISGSQHVLVAQDASAVCVVDNVSDASPSTRYILFRRKHDGTFSTSYLHPKMLNVEGPGEFDYDCPDVVGITHDTITFNYNGTAVNEAIAIEKVPTFRSPKNSE